VANPAPLLLLVVCAATAAGVTGILLGVTGRRVVHRRQIESGLLMRERLTYENPGSSVEHRDGEARAFLGTGRKIFDGATARVMRWEVKTVAGFRVIRVGDRGAFFSDLPVVAGECAIVRFGPVREAVRVTRVIDEPRIRGFAYGTLPEHPLRGEEAFLVEWHDDDRVEFLVRSFARPNGPVWWLLTPLVAVARRVFRRRYLAALLD
jgi:uncharacterized protein (UPF0548 family)